MTTIPASARLLGWAGLVPFAAGAAVAFGWPDARFAAPALLAYGAVILSFMAGCQWGLTVRAPSGGDRGWRGYAVSVVPALVAWVASLVGGRFGLGILAVTFAVLLAYDLRTVRIGWAPAWYGRLRMELTTVVVPLLGLTAALA